MSHAEVPSSTPLDSPVQRKDLQKFNERLAVVNAGSILAAEVNGWKDTIEKYDNRVARHTKEDLVKLKDSVIKHRLELARKGKDATITAADTALESLHKVIEAKIDTTTDLKSYAGAASELLEAPTVGANKEQLTRVLMTVASTIGLIAFYNWILKAVPFLRNKKETPGTPGGPPATPEKTNWWRGATAVALGLVSIATLGYYGQPKKADKKAENGTNDKEKFQPADKHVRDLSLAPGKGFVDTGINCRDGDVEEIQIRDLGKPGAAPVVLSNLKSGEQKPLTGTNIILERRKNLLYAKVDPATTKPGKALQLATVRNGLTQQWALVDIEKDGDPSDTLKGAYSPEKSKRTVEFASIGDKKEFTLETKDIRVPGIGTGIDAFVGDEKIPAGKTTSFKHHHAPFSDHATLEVTRSGDKLTFTMKASDKVKGQPLYWPLWVGGKKYNIGLSEANNK